MAQRFVNGALGAGLLLAWAASVQAQTARLGPWGLQIGPAAGLNASTLGGPGAVGGSLASVYLGVALITPLKGAAYLEPQVLLYGTGGRTPAVDSTFGSGERTIRLAYIEVPVLVGINLGAGRVHPRLFLGPTVGIGVDCSQSVTVGAINVQASSCDSIGLSPRSFDLGVTAGGGLTFLTSRGTFSVDARYTAGLTAIGRGTSQKNRTLSLGIEFGVALRRH